MPDFVASTFICAPIEEVWKFHEAPDALFQLTPPAQDIRVLTHIGGIGVGARLVISVRLLGPFRTTWHALHIACTPPTLFIDEQESGPFSYWHHEHRFASVDGGTTLTDAISFRLPGGSLINWLAAPIVRLQLSSLFRYRHAATRRCCESTMPSY